MTAFPPHFDAQDVPHLGILFKRIREARGLSQSDIARALGVTASTISKFEGTGRSRRNRIVGRYVETLQSLCRDGQQAPYPLTAEAAELLIQLSSGGRVDSRQTLASDVSAYDFSLIASPNCPAELRVLLQRMRRSRWPAFICDGLWFVHAVNGAMLNLFEIDARSAILRRWESWHIIGAELAESSPVRDAHVCPDNHIPPTIWAFFRASAPYLFTPQMRALLWQLHLLSARNGQSFGEWWHSATAMTLYFSLNRSVRVLRRGQRHYFVSIMELESYFVPLSTKTGLPYFLGVMQPMGAEMQTAFEQMVGPVRPGDVFFAADFDPGHAFHVNCWPEVAREVLG